MIASAEGSAGRSAPPFTYSKSLAPYAKHMRDVLSAAFNDDYKNLATGVFVFRHDRLLLVQRAEGDSFPGCWETPGGACDAEDETVLHGAARELMEETGLSAVHFVNQIGSARSFQTSTGKLVVSIRFLVEVRSGETIMLDPKEHQNYVWVTEEELQKEQVGDIRLKFTNPEYKDDVLQEFSTKET